MAARAAKSPPRAYLLWGQEEIRKRIALTELIASLVPAEDRDLDVEYLDAMSPGVTGETILHAARDRAMFSERRVVVVLNAQRLRGPRHQRTQEILASGLSQLPDYATLILAAGAEDQDERKGKAPYLEPLMTALKKHGEVRSFPLMKPEELAGMVRDEAKTLGVRVAANAAQLLAQRAGPDSLAVLQETRKLAAYAGDAGEIRVQDVEMMVAPRPEESIWNLLDAIFTGQRKRALEILQDLRQSGAATQYLLTMMARSVRQLAQAKLLNSHRIGPTSRYEELPAEVAALLPQDGHVFKSGSDWSRKKLWQQAQALSWTQIQTALDRLTIAEAGLKGWEGGIADEDLALEVFITAVSQPPARRG